MKVATLEGGRAVPRAPPTANTHRCNAAGVAASLRTAQALMSANRFADALVLLESVEIPTSSAASLTESDHKAAPAAPLEAMAASREILYMRAACLRYLQQYQAAQTVLSHLLTDYPQFGRAYQERGHVLRAMGKDAQALQAYTLACQANPALLASWRICAELHAAAGRTEESRQCATQEERLAALPKILYAALNYTHEGQLIKAEQLVRGFLRDSPQHGEAMRLLADIGARLGVLDDAETLLEHACKFEPDNIAVRLDYVQILRKRQKYSAALAQAKWLYDRQSDNPIFQSHYAIERLQNGDFDGAMALFEQILAKLPNDSATLTSRGHALKTYGQTQAAIASYRQAFAAQPGHGDAYFALANLKIYRFTDSEITAMTAQESCSDIGFIDRVYFCFALGKAHSDLGNYDHAFAYYERGNRLRRQQSRYEAEAMSAEFDLQITICTAELFAKQRESHAATQRGKQNTKPAKQGAAGGGEGCPIFIVGLPRAGSTLLEQILASHSQVDGTLELPNIPSLAQHLRGREDRGAGKSRYPAVLDELSVADLTAMGVRYLDDTQSHRCGAPFFIDKMPNNFRHIALIQMILPKAKIIDARRAPMDCCFSCFSQLFAEGQEFTYGMDLIGHYYRNYVRLMRHWDVVLPGKILRVHHEDLLAEPEQQIRRLLQYCGLPFEPACLAFHETKRSIRTASSEQVRQPLNRSGVGRWQHFAPYLAPLKRALGPALTDYR